MINRAIAAALLAFTSIPLSAAPQNVGAALRTYVTRALTKCPDSKIELTPIDRPGPAGFVPVSVTQTSSDTSCGRQTYALFSPATGQVIIGTIIGLPLDNRSAEVRIAETTSSLLKYDLTVTVSPFPLPDGLRAVSMTRQTPWGPFSYHGFLDASQQFLVVGSRGSLSVDPGTTLVQSLGLENAVRRGNPKAPLKIIELSDFQCPTCGRAHKDVEPLIAKRLSKIDYYRLDLPLFDHHEWALPAALGARAIQKVAPAKYWSYVNFIFENQETIGRSQSFDTVLQNFSEDHDIDWKRIEKIYRSPMERAALLEQTSRAFDTGVNSTPTYIINGQVLGFGPSGSFTIAAIKKALGIK
jgi:protein-disulfide isomerase